MPGRRYRRCESRAVEPDHLRNPADRGQVNIKNARHQDDPRPLDEACTCPACRGYSRAYLHHVFRAGEIIASMLLTWHNLHYYQDLMAGLREAIAGGRLAAFEAEFHARRAEGDIDRP